MCFGRYAAIIVVTLVAVDLVTIALGIFPPKLELGDPVVGWLPRLPTGQMGEDLCTEYATGKVIQFIRNEDGCRTSFSARQLHEDTDLFKVAVTGDSQTELCAPNADTHFGVLERELQTTGLNAAVFARGAPRYSPLQAYLAIRELTQEYSADVLILNVYTGNDFFDMLRVDDRPHMVRTEDGYEIVKPKWYVYDPPSARYKSRVLYVLRSIAAATGVRGLWVRVRFLWDFATEQGKGFATVMAYMNDLRKSRAPEVGYDGAFSAQMLNQQLFFYRFPGSRYESTQRLQALLELVRRENPGVLLVLSALPSYQLVQQQPVDSTLLRTLARLPITYESGIREEGELYDSLSALAAEKGWLFVDSLRPLREYGGPERLYNDVDYHFQPIACEIIGRTQADVIGGYLSREGLLYLNK
jgi:hypothetical protein